MRREKARPGSHESVISVVCEKLAFAAAAILSDKRSTIVRSAVTGRFHMAQKIERVSLATRIVKRHGTINVELTACEVEREWAN
jgi:hypothetical protein